MTAPMSGAVVVTPPGVRVAMVNAAATSRCPTNPQLLHIMVRPQGLTTLRQHTGQVDDTR
ncbi:hypothetical protein JOD64_005391 [Micromonospora luteifusca]|uniref:Uncharacterized protein n=1 Tax=Micromonospora luteifusca TaxID=709860 RepID=A0ABS2M210_9ACTN|nr:hypothetical protein [Micromonospora luteifusca]MBM7494169.1 hypothetical protein [Micromonospora luteifusca]